MKKVLFLFVALALAGCTHEGVQTASNGAPSDRFPASDTLAQYKIQQIVDGGIAGKRGVADRQTLDLNAINGKIINANNYMQAVSILAQPAVAKDCKAKLSLTQQAGTVYLTIDNPAYCSNLIYKTPQGNWIMRKFANGQGSQTIALAAPQPPQPGDNAQTAKNDFAVYLSSNTGVTSAQVNIHLYTMVPPRPPTAFAFPFFTLSTSDYGSHWGYLSNCGGMVYVDTSQDNPSLIFSNANRCQNFRVVQASGYPADPNLYSVSWLDQTTVRVTLSQSMYTMGAVNVVAASDPSNSPAVYDVVGMSMSVPNFGNNQGF